MNGNVGCWGGEDQGIKPRFVKKQAPHLSGKRSGAFERGHDSFHNVYRIAPAPNQTEGTNFSKISVLIRRADVDGVLAMAEIGVSGLAGSSLERESTPSLVREPSESLVRESLLARRPIGVKMQIL